MAKKKKQNLEDTGQLSMMNQLEGVKYTAEQEKFVNYDGKDSVLLIATAGSGKTFSCVERLKKLIERGVDPSKIIFFSFTKAATEELITRVGREDIKITTIHGFALGMLAKMGKFKKIVTIYDFIKWYKDTFKPAYTASKETKAEFYNQVGDMYDDAEYIASAISAYKLQTADDIECPMPPHYNLYTDYLIQSRSRDFSDMLINVRDALKEDKWLSMFKNKYDYIFVDEYQDTSTIQFQILLSLNADRYYLIGDRNQSIYSYSGANCNRIEDMLKTRMDRTGRKTELMSLSVNFRSDQNIVKNSNQFSSLKAVANSDEDGFVKKYIIFDLESRYHSKTKQQVTLGLLEVFEKHSEIAVLVRTNSVIRGLEFEFLRRKIPMRYFNYIREKDFMEYKNGNVHPQLRERLDSLAPYFDSDMAIFTFIEQNKNLKKFITTIHKSKGREFDYCVVVNSIDPFLLGEVKGANGVSLSEILSPKQLEHVSFNLAEEDNVEPRNIHYVAVSRPRHGLYYMLYNL